MALLKLLLKRTKERVTALAGWMQSQGVVKGDRVAAHPKYTQAVETMLAADHEPFIQAAPDFGFNGVFDRFSQIEPIAVTVDGYFYAGKKISRVDVIHQLMEKLPSLVHILVHDYSGNASDLLSEPKISLYSDALKHSPIEEYTLLNSTILIYLFSITGAPKCIVHSVGGTLCRY